MSEKRFELAYEQGNWWAVRDGDITLWKEEVVDKLNEQQDTITALKEENEKLKKENRMLKKDLNKLYNLLMDKGMSHNELQDVLW